jgi:lysophospholipase L1-like esterase
MIQERPGVGPESVPSSGRKILLIILSNLLAFGLLCVLGEAALRVIARLPGHYRSAQFRMYDSTLGLTLIPNLDVIHSRGCFEGEVRTNRWGMRDRDRSLAKDRGKFRIALMGDSIVEGVHVKPDQVMNIQLEKLLASEGYSNAEVLNFGLGSIGTTQEYLMYKDRVRQFHPDLVVLMFSDNDVMNNSSTIQPEVYGIHTWFAPYYNLNPNGQLVFQPVERRPFNTVRTFLEKHSVLAYYLARIWFRFNPTMYRWNGLRVEWGSYGDPLDPEWQSAWTVTEKVLTLLKNTVESNGSRFLVVVPPSFYDLDPDWRARFSKAEGEIPPEMNVATLAERLEAIAQRNNISMSFLKPYFIAYRNAHDLKWPYFSLSCDPHYSSMGHEVMAEAILQRLEAGHFLPARITSAVAPGHSLVEESGASVMGAKDSLFSMRRR